MAQNTHDGNEDRLGDKRERREHVSEDASKNADEYEITAKDAGWRTPTFLVSRATVTYFDPPRPRKPS
jgi:hypothetical protein